MFPDKIPIKSLTFFVLCLSSFISSSTGYFEYCDHVLDLQPNASIYVNSPYYPNRYPSGSSCRYVLKAPQDYQIVAQCTINLDKGSQNCDTEWFYVAIDGNKELSGEYFCGQGYVQRKSLFNKFAIAYTSLSQNSAGSFTCYVTTEPQPCDCGWSLTSKIIGGIEAKIHEYPFMAAIYHVPSRKVFCSGTIISHRHVLSAAHCFNGVYTDIGKMLVIVGEHDIRTTAETPYTQSHYVDFIKIHEYYNTQNDNNDIALITTSSNMEWSIGVGPACLPFLYTFATFEGKKADIAGWGTTSFAGRVSPVLLKATVDVVSNRQCQMRFPYVTQSQMCTYTPGKDSCQFDSGGPLIVRLNRMVAVGIISYGSACGSSPGVNTRLTSYLKWIQNNARVNFCRK